MKQIKNNKKVVFLYAKLTNLLSFLTRFRACDYLSMLKLQSNHVSKRRHMNGACAIRNCAYLVRGPWLIISPTRWLLVLQLDQAYTKTITKLRVTGLLEGREYTGSSHELSVSVNENKVLYCKTLRCETNKKQQKSCFPLRQTYESTIIFN